MLDVRSLIYSNFGKSLNKQPQWLQKTIVKIAKKLFCEDKFNKISQGKKHLKGLEFTDNLLDGLGISYTVKPNQLKNIPTTGKLIVIANHITGMQDSFSLVQLIANIREDKKIKIIINSMMSGVSNGFEWSIPVNINGSISKSSLKEIYSSLENDEAIIIFPAGFVNRFSFFNGLKDIAWKASFLKIAQKSQTPILPIKIRGRNSIMFYILSIIVPDNISALFLPREFANSGQRKPLCFNIGKVIPSESFSNKEINTQEYINMFYQHLYTLEQNNGEILKTEITIGAPKNKKILKDEVRKAEFLGTTIDGKKIILADAEQSPFLLRELGRVREISFRAIGGGTGRSHDNDLYDNYYRHLILWDDEDLEIVGAYRIGECTKIIKERGKEALYTYNLCNFNEHFEEYRDNSVELGRSFVQPKYWGSRALDNLWQGVGAYLAYHPKIKYTYGTVTINADTPKQAVEALVYFYSFYFSCETKMMKAKTPYIISDENESLFYKIFKDLEYKEAFVILKKYLKDMGSSVPTLFKQYAELYEEGAVRFFDFNVNTAWAGVIEGFIIADNSKMKPAKRTRYIENFKKLNKVDSLTSLHNHAHFMKIVNEITKYQRRIDIDFVLAIVKIRNFKYITKETPEGTWDKVIKNASKKITKCLRDNDVIARWDNAEFIIIIRNITPEEEILVIEKLIQTIQSVKIDDETNSTCRIGTTKYIKDEDIHDTINRTKISLEKAKQI